MSNRSVLPTHRPLRRLGSVMLVMLSLLLLNVGYIQVVKSDEYRSDPANRRTAVEDFNRQRGQIVAAGGVVLARSAASTDEYRYQRSYPGGAAYGNVTGFLSLNYGSAGLESSYNSVLSGDDPGLLVDNVSDLFTGRDPRGGNIELTLVPKLQQLAYSMLTQKGYVGAVVAIRPKTGEVLALVTSPSYDPNKLASHSPATQSAAYQQYASQTAPGVSVNRATESVYPPGSTFKLVVAAAALQHGFTPTSAVTGVSQITLPATNGATLSNFGGETCADRGGSDVNLTDALAHSCNTAFAQVAMKLGADTLRTQAQAFGIGESWDLADTQVAVSRTGEMVDEASVAQSGIGQRDVAETPLQNAVITATIANGGTRMQPYLVSRITKPDLSLLEPATEPVTVNQAVPPEIATQVRDMMIASEKNISVQAPASLKIASKTGTAEYGTDPKANPPHTWYTAFAPYDDPQIAVSVFVSAGGDKGLAATGATVAAPIGRAIIAKALEGQG
ncbi:MAG: penicillin-binding protein 2 [Nakamurella sp.]